MKALVWLVVLVIMGGTAVQLYHLYVGNRDLRARLEDSKTEEIDLAEEKSQLQADVAYFSRPENLAKELKAKFDYKRPGEKLIKIQ